MRTWLKIGGIIGIVALVGMLAWSAVAFAQGPRGGGPFFGPDGFRGGPPGGPGGFGGDEFFGPGGFRGGPPGGPGGFGGTIDREALLAEALGITVETLRAAQEEADLAAVQQALDQGLVTQEEADTMTSRIRLKNYLDHEALLAEALGITEADLQQARTEGKPMAVVIYELGLDPATVRTNMQTAFESAIQQAVDDEVISQEQADQILSGPGQGFGRPGGFGGPGRFGGFGGHHGFGGN